jgi:hypothetical protein
MSEKISKPRGGPKWIPTPTILKQIEDDASMGFNNQTIAAGLGIAAAVFSTKKLEYPEITAAMEKGRRRGLTQFYQLSLSVAQDLKYGQAERDRLARMLKAESNFSNELTSDDISVSNSGFTVSVISKKKPIVDEDDNT